MIRLSRLPADTVSLRSKGILVTYAVVMFIPPSAGFSNEVVTLPPGIFKGYDKIWFCRMSFSISSAQGITFISLWHFYEDSGTASTPDVRDTLLFVCSHCLICNDEVWQGKPRLSLFFWRTTSYLRIRFSSYSSGRAIWGVGLRPLACWDFRFESCRGCGCLSLVTDVSCQVEVSATGWSLSRGPLSSVCIDHWLWPRVTIAYAPTMNR